MDLITLLGKLYRKSVTAGTIQTRDGYRFELDGDRLIVRFPDGEKQVYKRINREGNQSSLMPIPETS